MHKLLSNLLMVLVAFAATGCVATGAANTRPAVSLMEVENLHKQGVTDTALIQTLQERGINFILTPTDAVYLKQVGVSDAVIRYLEGRADGARLAQRRYQYEHPYYHSPYAYPYGFYHRPPFGWYPGFRGFYPYGFPPYYFHYRH